MPNIKKFKNGYKYKKISKMQVAGGLGFLNEIFGKKP